MFCTLLENLLVAVSGELSNSALLLRQIRSAGVEPQLAAQFFFLVPNELLEQGSFLNNKGTVSTDFKNDFRNSALPMGQKWAVELDNGWLKLFVNAERWAELMFLLTIPRNKATALRDFQNDF